MLKPGFPQAGSRRQHAENERPVSGALTRPFGAGTNQGDLDAPNLDEGDVLAMVRLLSNVIAEAGDGHEKRHHLLGGLCEMIRADCWVWSLFESPRKARQPLTCLTILEGVVSREHSAPTLRPGSLSPVFFSELHRRYVDSPAMRQPSKSRSEPPECAAYLLCSDAGKVPAILSRRAASLNSFSIIGFYRSPEQPVFSPRELQLADIILSEVPWLHDQHCPSARASAPPLPPRQRETLHLLIQGQSRNEIAAVLRISVHTVGEYAKAIYRHFGVQSRAELMRRFPGGL